MHLRLLMALLALSMSACGSADPTTTDESASTQAPARQDMTAKADKRIKGLPQFDSEFIKVDYTEVDLDPGNDSLWYHLVLDIPGDAHLAVAQPLQESNRRGVRMQLLLADTDTSFRALTESSPGYDSAMLFPTFFVDAHGRHIILADTGERESWGQKVYLLDQGVFTDLGFIDVGLPMQGPDNADADADIIPKNIAPVVRLDLDGKGGIDFRFETEEIILFDDTQGHLDTLVRAKDYLYNLSKRGRWKLKRS